MRTKSILVALAAASAALVMAASNSSANAMGPLAASTVSKADSSMVEKVHRRRWNRAYRGYDRYPRGRWYSTRPYYSRYYAPYYAPPPYYRSYYYPYGGYYVQPRYYDYGYYGYYRPRVRIGIGF
jgi:hypothetical protein